MPHIGFRFVASGLRWTLRVSQGVIQFPNRTLESCRRRRRILASVIRCYRFAL